MLRNLTKYFRRHARVVPRFCGAQQGTTAVEFALIAPAFIGLLIAIIETTLFLFAQATLQNAAVQAGRQFMTGQAQNGSVTQTQFTNNTVCPLIRALFTCSKLIVVVQDYADFAAASTSAPTLYTNGTLNTTWTYSPGNPGDVMVVQLVYQWPVISGPLGFSLSNLPGGAIEMMGIAAFRVEPY